MGSDICFCVKQNARTVLAFSGKRLETRKWRITRASIPCATCREGGDKRGDERDRSIIGGLGEPCLGVPDFAGLIPGPVLEPYIFHPARLKRLEVASGAKTPAEQQASCTVGLLPRPFPTVGRGGFRPWSRAAGTPAALAAQAHRRGREPTVKPGTIFPTATAVTATSPLPPRSRLDRRKSTHSMS